MSNKSVLLLYISAYSGHHKAAQAIEQAIYAIDPSTKVVSLDALSYTTPIASRIIGSTYLEVIKRAPDIWKFLYNNKEFQNRTKKLKNLIHKHNSPRLLTMLEDIKPDVIACTQAYPCGMIADLKKTHNLKLPLIGVLTDYIAHIYWPHEKIDTYVVPAEPIRNTLVDFGVSNENIKTFGIPLDPKFLHKLDKDKIYQNLGLQKGIPCILVMGGGRGIGPIEKMVKMIDSLSDQLQLIIVCGTNEKLHRWCSSHKPRFKHNVIPFGYVDNIHELMEVSDVIITKPGGLTTQEALCKGLPMIIVNPIPGQEAMNTEFLVSAGAAEKVSNYKELLHVLKNFLGNPLKLEVMRQKALSHARPNSSSDIAKFILGIK